MASCGIRFVVPLAQWGLLQVQAGRSSSQRSRTVLVPQNVVKCHQSGHDSNSATWESYEIRFDKSLIRSKVVQDLDVLKWNGTYSIWGEIQLNDAKCVGLFGQTSGLLGINVFQLVQTISNNYGSFNHACTRLPESCILSILHHFQGFGQALPQWEPGNPELTLAKPDWRLLMAAGSAIKAAVNLHMSPLSLPLPQP